MNSSRLIVSIALMLWLAACGKSGGDSAGGAPAGGKKTPAPQTQKVDLYAPMKKHSLETITCVVGEHGYVLTMNEVNEGELVLEYLNKWNVDSGPTLRSISLAQVAQMYRQCLQPWIEERL